MLIAHRIIEGMTVVKGFNGYEYLQSMARRLIYDFSEAGTAGHPDLIGSARETPARIQLERVLPGNFGVGSGIVIDSFGGKSKQQDIVIYEKHLCPLFSVNDTPEATYFPIEGVMAVGEVKSRLDKEQLDDAFTKIISVKSLKRVVEPEQNAFGLPPTVPFRHYGSNTLISDTESGQFSVENSFDQVLGFVLAGNLSAKPETILYYAADLAASTRPEYTPNLIISLADGQYSWVNSKDNSLCRSAMEADMLAFIADSLGGFPWLIMLLRVYAEAGRTVSLRHYRKYFSRPEGVPIIMTKGQSVSWVK